jgi:sigma-54-specific transcriptional regulator
MGTEMTNSSHPQQPLPEGISAPGIFAVGGEIDRILMDLLAVEEDRILERLNERLLRLAFLKNGQNQVRTAKALGVSRNVLRTNLKRFGMIA